MQGKDKRKQRAFEGSDKSLRWIGVIRFQWPTVAQKERAEFPILPSPAPSPKLGCLSWGWVSKSGRDRVLEIQRGEDGFCF